jgi:hypothetical protein
MSAPTFPRRRALASPWLRIPAALGLLVVFLASQGLGHWHLALDRHEVCAEHGDWVEAGHGHHEAEVVATEASSGPRLVLPHSDEHHHCVVAALTHSSARPSPGAFVGVVVAPRPLVAVPVVEARSAVIPILHRAPKLSPPQG